MSNRLDWEQKTETKVFLSVSGWVTGTRKNFGHVQVNTKKKEKSRRVPVRLRLVY